MGAIALGLPFHGYWYFGRLIVTVSIGAALKEASRRIVVTVGRSHPWRQSSLYEGLSKAILTTGTCTVLVLGLVVVDMEPRLCRGLMEVEDTCFFPTILLPRNYQKSTKIDSSRRGI